jgi:hypothetical protein
MIHELVVTSAARGLQAGRSGFTTVLRTRGIHPELQAKLEQGSAYRHVYPQGDARNPRILSHALLQSPAGQVSVLSSIVDAGNGYDGRSNKLAHHLALDRGEVSARAKSSPASVLLALDRAGGLMQRWSGQPREEAASTITPPAPACEPRACSAWARAAGDAGWAGFVVERALRREQTWIVAPADCDLLELFTEALALVPPTQRWSVTFTTYAVGQPDMLWLGTVDGAPEAQAARGQSRVAVVDLVRKQPVTASSALVEAARGKLPVPWLAEPAALGSGGGNAGSAGATTATAPGRPPRIAGRPGAPPPLANPFAFATTPERQPRAAVPGVERPGRVQRRLWVPFVVFALATATIVAVIALAVPVLRQFFVDSGAAGPPRSGGARRSHATNDVEVSRATPRKLADDRAGTTPVTPSPPSATRSESLDRPPPAGDRRDATTDLASRSAGGLPIDRPSPPPPPPPPPPGPAPPAVNAFPDLCTALDDMKHLPVAGLDGGDPRESEVRLCVLHGARVIPRLPDATIALTSDGAQSRVSCVPAEAGGWRIVCSRVGATVPAQPFDVGRITVRDDALYASLNQRVAPNDPRFSEHAGARAAVATSILLLADPERPEEMTYVQLCRPVVGGPVVIERFFFDEKLRPQLAKHTPVKLFLGASLPSTPWPCRVRFEGAGLQGALAGRITASAAGYSSALRQEPISWTIEWSMPSGAPVMRTEMQLANKEVPDTDQDPCDTQLWLQSSNVLEPWSTFRFCADLNQAAPKRNAMYQLPRVSLLKIGTEVPANSDDAEIDFDVLKKFSKVCRQYPVPLFDLGPLDLHDRQPVSLWKERIRGLLAESADFRAWRAGVADESSQTPVGGEDGSLGSSDAAGKASPRAVAAYWAHLKSSEERLKTTPADVWLCCLLDELDTVPAQKQAAKTLIEGLGEGDAEFRGDIVADFGNGQNCVLLALGEKPPVFVNSRKPVPSAQRDPAKVQQPAAPVVENRVDVPPPVDR